MSATPDVRVGDTWRHLDPRGGPRFYVQDVCADGGDRMCWGRYRGRVPHAHVINLGTGPERPRTVKLARFRAHEGFRSGYALVERAQGDNS